MNIPIEEENMKCGLKGQHVDNMRMGYNHVKIKHDSVWVTL